MIDLITLINEINAESDEFLSSMRIEIDPDLGAFQKQPSDLDEPDFEWVKQLGDDYHGFHGTLAYSLELPDNSFLLVDFG